MRSPACHSIPRLAALLCVTALLPLAGFVRGTGVVAGAQSPATRGQSDVALDGHCPVTLLLNQQWIPGDPKLRLIFDGREYWFADARKRDVFTAAPQTYAPVLGGDCIVTYADGGGRTRGQLQHGAVYEGRLYFFASPVERRRFDDQPSDYVEADIANKGMCLVAEIDEQRAVPGLPDASALVNGERYLFSSVHRRTKFFEDPQRYLRPDELPDGFAAYVSPWAIGAGQHSSSRFSLAPGAAPIPRRAAAAAGAFRANVEEGEQIELAGAPLLSGYCPVSLRDHAAWVHGLSDYRTNFHGTTFLLAGRAEQQAFLAAPEMYLPVLGGDCIVAYVDEGRRVRGSVYFATFYPTGSDNQLTDESRLYLFASEENRDAFKVEPSDYANRDVAAAGICVVTRGERTGTNRIVPGDPKQMVWYRGLRYFFSGQEQRERFLADPERYVE